MRANATQSSPTANPDCRVTIDGAVYASIDIGGEIARLLTVQAHEMIYGGQYVIEIDNDDSTLSNVDYEGKDLILYFGFISITGSNLHNLKVQKQRHISKQGKLILQLECIDNMDKLSFYTGSLGGSLWNHPSQSMAKLDQLVLPSGDPLPAALKAAINAQYDKTPFEICTAVITATINKTVTLTDDDGYMNTITPIVSASDARNVVAQALEPTECYLKLSGDGFLIFQPSAHATAYSYDVANLIFSDASEQEVVLPNRVIFYGINAGGDIISTGATHGKSQESIDRMGEVQENNYTDWQYIQTISTQLELDSRADARIAKIELGKGTGVLVAPMHCSQELFDKIEITDDRYETPKVITGYVFEILREYDRGKYQITLRLGGVESGFTPAGGSESKISPIVMPLPPNLTDVPWETILPKAVQGYHHNITFTSIDQSHISWTAGTIKFYDGTTQAIDAGSLTLNSSAIKYLYFDLNDGSPTVIKNTEDYNSVMTEKTGLLCLAQKGSSVGIKATILPSEGKTPLITPDWIDMTGLKEYAYPDGTKLQGLFSTQIQAGHILLSAETSFASGYDPTGKEISVSRGSSAPSDTTKLWFDTTTGTMKAYVSGAWKVMEGEWYRKSGVAIDATKGIRLYGGQMSLKTYATISDYLSDINVQCYIDTAGAICAGGGSVKLDKYGLSIFGKYLVIKNAAGDTIGWLWNDNSLDALSLEVMNSGTAIRLVPNAADCIIALSSGRYLTVGGTGIRPSSNDTEWCGTPAAYWYASYADFVMYKTHSSFDHINDFEVIKAIKPSKKDRTKVDMKTLPKEVLDETGEFISMGGMMGLLQGTLKKAILRIETLEEELKKVKKGGQ